MSIVAADQYHEVELGEVEEGGSSVAAIDEIGRSPSKLKRQDVKWSKVNFRVKDKQILSDCWGHVVRHL